MYSFIKEERKMIGQNIKLFRENLGISQEELAHRARVHSNTIARWERDEVTPRGASLTKLANALQVTPAALLAEELDDSAQKTQVIFTKAIANKDIQDILPRAKVEDRGTLSYTFTDGQKLEVPATPEYAQQFWARVDKLIGLQPATQA